MVDPRRTGPRSLEELAGAAAMTEVPAAGLCRDLALAHERAGDAAAAVRWALAMTDAGGDLTCWSAAAGVLRRALPAAGLALRPARVAVLGSYTTAQFAALLPLAAARAGVAVEVYECGYGQYRQEVLDPASGLHRFGPDVVILAVHAGDTALPSFARDPEQAVAVEAARWTSLWQIITGRLGAAVIQHTFVVPETEPFGHLARQASGARSSLLAAVNVALGQAAVGVGGASSGSRGSREDAGGIGGSGVGSGQVSFVDCERLAATVGKRSWFDPRYWHRSKQAVSLAHVPALARHTAAVLGAQLGTSRKCLVLDLDNTLWGGVLGEDGLAGIALGDGPAGEAFSEFQEYIALLRERGVVLAVCSKNNDADARAAFERHPAMRLRLDDIAMFSASWDDKPTQIRRIAQTLGIGLDSLVFVDDNPAEREVVRQLVPEVDVIALPKDPHEYVRALADYPFFEPGALTAEDAARTEQYRARARAVELEASASSLEEFHRGLEMVATVVPLDELTLPRVVQLIGKTNQFNLTTRRRGAAEVAELAADPATVIICVRLADRFADHGLVAVVIARRVAAVVADADAEAAAVVAEAAAGLVAGTAVLDVDTWLMSCRVIGRTLECELAELIVAEARRLGCTAVRGHYLPTAKNSLVADLYARLGFQRVGAAHGGADGSTRWLLPVALAPERPGLIRVVDTRRHQPAPSESRPPEPRSGEVGHPDAGTSARTMQEVAG
ncbi:HAD-superfamily phosphatase, subfamily IIIC/FkbH-like domain-containing protein [Parafrankia irregularis]|uniref:HAD-superfamily phosphatase, subfamily IIIC/FkbH-like domain-containing protein n=1 Tax=Parafrankia irregularis TaxID=795642 RepID=A0A0S4QY87_9ACTN|nr:MULTISPECIES: HAD-IIIC family phosphatase [Parafrankia]MBE3203396.1 HAD family hydrolase [Parafrankia sp. CH37]CUU60260.1 HAD-superfamily phosphatase, subfamily IIIC/FkbH-like domain-containing protein [Parafrankia irregularis]